MKPEEQIEEVDAPEVDDAEPVEAVEDAPPAQEPEAEMSEAEREARYFGWKPPNEWVGEPPPRGFIETPEAFMDNLEKSTPFRKAQERLDKERKRVDQELQKIAGVAKQLVQQQRQHAEGQLRAVIEAQTRAVEEGDTDAFQRLKKTEDNLRQHMAKQRDEPAEEPDNPHKEAFAVIEKWSAGKEWFRKDPVMTKATEALWAEAEQEGYSEPEAILTYVDRRLEEEFPHKFNKTPKPKPRAQSAVEGGLNFGNAGGRDGGFSKLSTEAKSAFDKFVKQGLFENSPEGRKKYMDIYKEQPNV